MNTRRWFLLAASALITSGCVTQQLVVKTTPPGANVYYNGELIGQSPLTHAFLWYEPYQIRVEQDGQPPLQENGVIKAPLWMWFPLDGIMALLPLPFRDRYYVTFNFAQPKPEHVAAAQEPQEPPLTHTGVIDDLRRIHGQPR